MILHKVSRFIADKKLFSQKHKIIVALSGGADSVALLHILHQLGYNLEAAHCNFHLRGQESDRDQKSVEDLCAQLQIPIHVISFSTQEYARQQHISLEMAARELRYSWFENLRNQLHADYIAVAHHQDDSAETILLNLLRGTGIKGLTGIHPKNGNIVRPLLCLDRKEIVSYLNNRHLEYVTDSTNLQDEYTRNKIRLHILPLMEEINPSIRQTLVETGERMQEVANIYQTYISEKTSRILIEKKINIHLLLKETAPRSILFEMLHPLGFNVAQTNDIFQALKGQPGKMFHSPQWKLVKDREYLLLYPSDADTQMPQLTCETLEYTPGFAIPSEKNIACFDADKLGETYHIRKWKQGDTFVPFGMKGKKKVSDYLTDRKLSLLQKENQWLLCSGEQIAWVIGERIDDRFRIDQNTKRVTIFTLHEQ